MPINSKFTSLTLSLFLVVILVTSSCSDNERRTTSTPLHSIWGLEFGMTMVEAEYIMSSGKATDLKKSSGPDPNTNYILGSITSFSGYPFSSVGCVFLNNSLVKVYFSGPLYNMTTYESLKADLTEKYISSGSYNSKVQYNSDTYFLISITNGVSEDDQTIISIDVNKNLVPNYGYTLSYTNEHFGPTEEL